jgi:hypothetical protein
MAQAKRVKLSAIRDPTCTRSIRSTGKQTKNECFAMNIRTREIVVRVNNKVGEAI